MATPSQDYAASITWTQTWAAHLTANGSAFTISSATATCSTTGVTVSGTTVTGSGTSVTFKVSQTGLSTTVPLTVNVIVTPTMSNGDVDQRDFPILFTNL